MATHATVVAQPTAPRLRLIEELRLDGNDQDFTYITNLAIGPRGRMAIHLPKESQIRIYDSSGKRMTPIGRKGRGPGEFLNPWEMGWIADTLWVFDHALRRLSFFTSAGVLVRTTPLPDSLGRGDPGREGVGAILSLWVKARYADGSMRGTATVVHRHDTKSPGEPRVVFLPAGAPPRIVATPPSDEPFTTMVEMAQGRSYATVPFAFHPSVKVSNDGGRIGVMTVEPISPKGGTFTVTVLRRSGDTLFKRAYAFVGVPIPADAGARALKEVGLGPAEVVAAHRRLAQAKMPPVYSPVQALQLGLTSGAWVVLRKSAEGTIAIQLNDNGGAVGSVRLPDRSTILAASTTQLWLLEEDADGVESLARYRVVR